jgi:hypothetical protein
MGIRLYKDVVSRHMPTTAMENQELILWRSNVQDITPGHYLYPSMPYK